jgi:hypothetical protein
MDSSRAENSNPKWVSLALRNNTYEGNVRESRSLEKTNQRNVLLPIKPLDLRHRAFHLLSAAPHPHSPGISSSDLHDRGVQC